jgi:hypothetical protein
MGAAGSSVKKSRAASDIVGFILIIISRSRAWFNIIRTPSAVHIGLILGGEAIKEFPGVCVPWRAKVSENQDDEKCSIEMSIHDYCPPQGSTII